MFNIWNLGILPYVGISVIKDLGRKFTLNLGQVGPKCNHMYPYEKEDKQVLRQTQKKKDNTHRRGKGNVTAEAEAGVIQPQPRNADSYQKTEEASLLKCL